MKKVLLVLFLLTCSINIFSKTLALKGGINLPGDVGNLKVKNGYTFGLEYAQASGVKNVTIGLGMSYNSDVDYDLSGDNVGTSLYPVYSLIRLRLKLEEVSVLPYVFGRIGWAMSSNSDVDGGIYYGAGMGIELNKTHIELFYSGDSGDLEYKKLTLNVGYKLANLKFIK